MGALAQYEGFTKLLDTLLRVCHLESARGGKAPWQGDRKRPSAGDAIFNMSRDAMRVGARSPEESKFEAKSE